MNGHLKKSNESIFRQRNTKINYINQLYLLLILRNMLFFKKNRKKIQLKKFENSVESSQKKHINKI